MESRSVDGAASQSVGRVDALGRVAGVSATAPGAVPAVALVLWGATLLAVLNGLSCAVLVMVGTFTLGSGLLACASTLLILGVTAIARRQRRHIDTMRAQAAQRDRAVSDLRAERDLAADSSASKTRFFAAASHDLRQPLHALAINATTLQLVAGRQEDPVIRDLSASITRALARSNGLLDSLLDLSRLDSNSVRLKLEEVSVRSLLVAACEQFAPSAAERGLVLEVVAVETIPEDLQITTDLVLMFRVLANLLSNAIKFTHQGSVRLSVLEDHRHVTIRVIDTGRGIAAHELPHIFEEFYQVGSPPRDAEGGLGLGLSIVRRAVDLLGIEIDIRSVVGSGTVVSLNIPLKASMHGHGNAQGNNAQHDDDSAFADSVWHLEQPEDADATLAIKALASVDPVRVLLVEDEREICASLEGLLPHVGYEIRSATTSGEALAIIASGFLPTVLVIDQLLRNDTGLLVVHRLWKVLGRVPAVMVTGDTDDSTAELALASGMRVVHKPVDGVRMARLISEAQADRAAGQAGRDAAVRR